VLEEIRELLVLLGCQDLMDRRESQACQVCQAFKVYIS
jgi:hypothetical protein